MNLVLITADKFADMVYSMLGNRKVYEDQWMKIVRDYYGDDLQVMRKPLPWVDSWPHIQEDSEMVMVKIGDEVKLFSPHHEYLVDHIRETDMAINPILD